MAAIEADMARIEGRRQPSRPGPAQGDPAGKIPVVETVLVFRSEAPCPHFLLNLKTFKARTA